jgi:hypothetical protein
LSTSGVVWFVWMEVPWLSLTELPIVRPLITNARMIELRNGTYSSPVQSRRLLILLYESAPAQKQKQPAPHYNQIWFEWTAIANERSGWLGMIEAVNWNH